MRSRPIVALLLAGVAAGCAPTAPTAAPTGVATAPATAAATGSPTAVPPTTPSASESARTELRASGQGLPPGRYVASGFDPPITLDLDGSWAATTVVEGFFELPYKPDAGLAIVQVTLVEAVLDGDPSIRPSTTPATAAEAVAAIKKKAHVTVIETSGSKLGGLDGEQVTIERPAEAGGTLIPGWQVLGTPAGELSLSPGGRYWMAFFDAPQGLVAVLVRGTTARWEPALLVAEPVLETITFVTP